MNTDEGPTEQIDIQIARIDAQIEQIEAMSAKARYAMLGLQVASESLRFAVGRLVPPGLPRDSISSPPSLGELLLDPIPFAERLPGPRDLVECKGSGWFWAGRQTILGWRWLPYTDPVDAQSDNFTHWLPVHVRYLPGRLQSPLESDREASAPAQDLFAAFETICGLARNYIGERGEEEGLGLLEACITIIRDQLLMGCAEKVEENSGTAC